MYPAKRLMERVTALLALLVLSAPATLVGQDSDGKAKAKEYYEQGMQSFYSDDYAMAITYFKRAHSLSPSGTLLYNISIAYSRMGKPSEAMTYSERAATHDDLPDDTVVKNRARMAGYSVALRTNSLTEPETASPPAKPGARSSATGPAEGPPADKAGGGHTLGWIGAGIGLAGVGLLTGAGVVNLNVQSKIDDKNAAEDSGDFERANQLYDDIETQQQTGRILLYAGGGAAALGATLFVLDLTSSSSSTDETALRIRGGPRADGWTIGWSADF